MSVFDAQGLTRRFEELTAVDELTISVEATKRMVNNVARGRATSPGFRCDPGRPADGRDRAVRRERVRWPCR